MRTTTNGNDSHISFWPRVREFAVPPSMIDEATSRRHAGDWRGACAAAGFEVDIGFRALADRHGAEVARWLLDDLRHLAPDLLRWHLPRVAPDGLLRPGLTIALARYGPPDVRRRGSRIDSAHLVVRIPPAWADSGQRVVLTCWDGTPSEVDRHPHPRPDRRFRFDLHRHLWDDRRTRELRSRCGAEEFDDPAHDPASWPPDGRAIGRWAAEARILLRADALPEGPVRVRSGARQESIIDPYADDPPSHGTLTCPRGAVSGLPVLPDAATWVLPDLMLLRDGAVTVDTLHPLVAEALAPGVVRSGGIGRDLGERARTVWCRGELHRIGPRDGVLSALDHDPAQIRREELLAALSGTPLPCLQAIDRAHRRPDCLAGVRERLDHGDHDGALAVVRDLLGPDAELRDGPLRDALAEYAAQRAIYREFRTGRLAPASELPKPARRRVRRAHPRHASHR